MKIRQEESTPIGNYFHDSGIEKDIRIIEETVDEFDVDTDDLCFHIDETIGKLKSLKAQIAKVEAAWVKHLRKVENKPDD